MGKDYYAILGVDKKASQVDIKKAFRALAHKYHPDKKDGNEEKFKEANEAYQALGNEKNRAKYDQFGSGFNPGQGPGGFDGMNINMDDLGDIFGGFGDIFGFGGGQQQARHRSPQRGRDLEMSLELDFTEAVFGVEKKINLRKLVICDDCHGDGAEPGSRVDTCAECKGIGTVTRLQRTMLGNIQTKVVCPACGGEGKIIKNKCKKCGGSGRHLKDSVISTKIPAGIDDGETIRLSGQGEAGEKGAGTGDLYLHVRVKEDKDFKRFGYDISSKVKIGFTQAALGDKIDIKTVYGVVKLKIPEGTQSGTIFKLRGKGIVRLKTHGQGDHLIEVIVKTPDKLNRQQKSVLRELNI